MNSEENSVALPDQEVVWVRSEGKKTKGQLFKEKHGYSRTLSRLANKHNLSVEDYKKTVRKTNRLAIKKEKTLKRDRARAGRKSKDNKLSSKKK